MLIPQGNISNVSEEIGDFLNVWNVLFTKEVVGTVGFKGGHLCIKIENFDRQVEESLTEVLGSSYEIYNFGPRNLVLKKKLFLTLGDFKSLKNLDEYLKKSTLSKS